VKTVRSRAPTTASTSACTLAAAAGHCAIAADDVIQTMTSFKVKSDPQNGREFATDRRTAVKVEEEEEEVVEEKEEDEQEGEEVAWEKA